MATVAFRLRPFVTRVHADIDAAGLKMEVQKFALILGAIATFAWAWGVIVFKPDPATTLVALFLCASVATVVGRLYLVHRRTARIAAFREQLEGTLRTLAGGVRVGLGIRQALVLTSELAREPTKTELTRVVGLSNLGMSTLEAIDQLAARMTNPETAIFARVVRVQSETGGDLASVLDGLAGTIRDRRRLRRRVSAVTAQGRATAWLLGLLPLAVGLFMLTQGELRDAMLFTLIGRFFLGAALALDLLAIVALWKITRFDP